MNPHLFMPAFIAAMVGLCTGWTAGYCIRCRRLLRASRIGSGVLAALAWITFCGGLVCWHGYVVPGFDGLEGAGVGFGWVLLHVWGAALVLLLTGVAIGMRICPNRIREVHELS